MKKCVSHTIDLYTKCAYGIAKNRCANKMSLTVRCWINKYKRKREWESERKKEKKERRKRRNKKLIINVFKCYFNGFVSLCGGFMFILSTNSNLIAMIWHGHAVFFLAGFFFNSNWFRSLIMGNYVCLTTPIGPVQLPAAIIQSELCTYLHHTKPPSRSIYNI